MDKPSSQPMQDIIAEKDISESRGSIHSQSELIAIHHKINAQFNASANHVNNNASASNTQVNVPIHTQTGTTMVHPGQDSKFHATTCDRVKLFTELRARLASLSVFYECLPKLLESDIFSSKTLVHKNFDDGRVLWKVGIQTPAHDEDSKRQLQKQLLHSQNPKNLQNLHANSANPKDFQNSPSVKSRKHTCFIKMQLVDADEKLYRSECKEVFAMEILEPFIKHQILPGTVLMYQYHSGMVYKKDFGELVNRKRQFWPNSPATQIGIVSVQEAAAPLSLDDILKKAAKDRKVLPDAYIISCIYQVLTNHLSISYYTGLAHNDMYARNIFFIPIDNRVSIRYHWPQHTSDKLVDVTTIPAMSALWLIGDWGCVSSQEWDGVQKHNCGEGRYHMDVKKDRSQWGHWHHSWLYSNLGPIRRDWLAFLSSVLLADVHFLPISAYVRQWIIYMMHELLDMTDQQLSDHTFMAHSLQRWFSHDIISRYQLQSIFQNPADPSSRPEGQQNHNMNTVDFYMIQPNIKSEWLRIYDQTIARHQKEFMNVSSQIYKAHFQPNVDRSDSKSSMSPKLVPPIGFANSQRESSQSTGLANSQRESSQSTGLANSQRESSKPIQATIKSQRESSVTIATAAANISMTTPMTTPMEE
jgi:hypothetical protein